MQTGKKMWKAYTALRLFMLIVTTTAVGQGDKWYVAPGGDDTAGTNWSTAFKTITNATARAQAFDEIIISNGIYYTINRIDIPDNVTFRGFTGDPRDVTIDGSKDTRPIGWPVFRVYSNAVLAAVTITNGHNHGVAAADGGGVQLYGYGILSNCVVTGNTADRGGGGVAVMNPGSNAKIVGCIIRNNHAVVRGGGIAVALSSSMIIDSEIRENRSEGYAGGVYNDAHDTLISGCSIISNTAEVGDGGGIKHGRLRLTVSNSIIAFNSAPVAWGGGGVYMNVASAKFYNCLFYSNRVDTTRAVETDGGGGGLFLLQISTGEVYNCTFIGNSANKGGGGIHARPTDTLTIKLINNIMYDNNVDTGAYSNYFFGVGSIAIVSNNCAMPVLAGGADGNIAFDPEFINPNEGNFRLQRSSCCINAGIKSPWMAGAKDLDGRSRIDRFSRQVDIGCYEYISRGSIYIGK